MATWFDWPVNIPVVPETALLLTDGSVWLATTIEKRLVGFRLIPDAMGHYESGSFRPFATLDANPGVISAVVLADGRVLTWLIQSTTTAAAIYDPVNDGWTLVPAPPGWSGWPVTQASVLADGRVLARAVKVDKNQLPTTTPTWIYDPRAGVWTEIADHHADSRTDESATFGLLPDGSVLAVNWFRERAERFVDGAWVPAAAPPTGLFSYYPAPDNQPRSAREGVLLLLPDGRVLVSGREGTSAYYIPPAARNGPGVWAPAPTVPPNGIGEARTLARGIAILLPTGNVLCLASHETNPFDGTNPESFLEFDGVSFTSEGDVSGNGYRAGTLLPTGQVLISLGNQSPRIYTPSGTARADLIPFVDPIAEPIASGSTMVITGRRLNGVSQATCVSFSVGATNYPLCSFFNLVTGEVTYARTFGHSTMGVATGGISASTNVEVPNLQPGFYRMYVSVNGASSYLDVEIAERVSLDFDFDKQVLWITNINDDGSVDIRPAIRIILPSGKVVLIPLPKKIGFGGQLMPPPPPPPEEMVWAIENHLKSLPAEFRRAFKAPLAALIHAVRRDV